MDPNEVDSTVEAAQKRPVQALHGHPRSPGVTCGGFGDGPTAWSTSAPPTWSLSGCPDSLKSPTDFHLGRRWGVQGKPWTVASPMRGAIRQTCRTTRGSARRLARPVIPRSYRAVMGLAGRPDPCCPGDGQAVILPPVQENLSGEPTGPRARLSLAWGFYGDRQAEAG